MKWPLPDLRRPITMQCLFFSEMYNVRSTIKVKLNEGYGFLIWWINIKYIDMKNIWILTICLYEWYIKNDDPIFSFIFCPFFWHSAIISIFTTIEHQIWTKNENFPGWKAKRRPGINKIQIVFSTTH